MQKFEPQQTLRSGRSAHYRPWPPKLGGMASMPSARNLSAARRNKPFWPPLLSLASPRSFRWSDGHTRNTGVLI